MLTIPLVTAAAIISHPPLTVRGHSTAPQRTTLDDLLTGCDDGFLFAVIDENGNICALTFGDNAECAQAGIDGAAEVYPMMRVLRVEKVAALVSPGRFDAFGSAPPALLQGFTAEDGAGRDGERVMWFRGPFAAENAAARLACLIEADCERYRDTAPPCHAPKQARSPMFDPSIGLRSTNLLYIDHKGVPCDIDAQMSALADAVRACAVCGATDCDDIQCPHCDDDGDGCEMCIARADVGEADCTVDTALSWDGTFTPCHGDVLVRLTCAMSGIERSILVSARYTRPVSLDDAELIAIDAAAERYGDDPVVIDSRYIRD